jgi:hypothetical protein
MRARLLLVLILGVVACGQGAGEGVTSTSVVTDSTLTSTTTVASPSVVNQAIEDLSARLRVASGEIEVDSAVEVTWPDGSLGCPEPGKVYTQALVDGWLIVLVNDGERYAYHQGGDGDPFLCEIPGNTKFVPPKGSID